MYKDNDFQTRKLLPSAEPMELIGTKVPPHSLKAERAVLGALIIDKKAIIEVLAILTPEMFYNQNHRIIFETISEMFDKKIPVDSVILGEVLASKEQLQLVFKELLSAETPTSANVAYHATIVKERWVKRELIRQSGQTIANCYDDTTDALEQIDHASEALLTIQNARMTSGMPNPLADVKAINTYIDRTLAGDITRLQTPFVDLNKKVRGFMAGDFVLVAGRPSMGKTALVLSMMYKWAYEDRIPVAFFSLDSMTQNIIFRLAALHTSIPVGKFRDVSMDMQELQKVTDFLELHLNSQLYIDDRAKKFNEIRTIAHRLKDKYNIQALAVDYIQSVHGNKSKNNNRNDELSEISDGFKTLAKELEITVIALAQLNRAVESRADKTPQMSDLRDCGTLEQDADMIIFPYRPEYYGVKESKDKDGFTMNMRGKAEIKIAKGRDVGTGSCYIGFEEELAKFYSLELAPSIPHFADTEKHKDEEMPF